MTINRFGAHRQTKSQNVLAFKVLLNSMTDSALTRADPESLSRSYGLKVADVGNALLQERLTRSVAG